MTERDSLVARLAVTDEMVERFRHYAKEADRPVPPECLVTPQAYEFEEWADALTRLSEQIASLKKERDNYELIARSKVVSHRDLNTLRAEAAESRLAELTEENARLDHLLNSKAMSDYVLENEVERRQIAEARVEAAESRLAELEQEAVKVVSALNSRPNNHEVQNAARAFLDKLRRPS